MKKPSVKKVMVIAQKQKTKAKRSRPKTTRLGLIGQIAGGFWGPHGSDLGRAAGNAISKITGMGDYKVNSNTVVGGNTIPTFLNNGDGVKVCHREFVSDVVGSVAFVLTSYSINPGLSILFPLLSQIAQTFEEYDLRGLVMEYRPTSGTAISSTSSALGVVVMATNYDATDPLFTNKQQMESYEYSNSTVPFNGCIHPIECARNRNVLQNLFIRTTTSPAGTDLRFSDLGNFQIATAGMQSAYTIGELWVSYDVFLRKPRLNISPTLSSCFCWHASTGPNLSSGTNSLLLGPTPYIDGPDSRVSIIQNTSSVILLLPATGTYFLSYVVTTPGLFTTSLTQVNGSNLSTNGLLQAHTASGAGNNVGSSAIYSYTSCIRVNVAGSSSNNYVTINYQANSASCLDIVVSKLPGLSLGARWTPPLLVQPKPPPLFIDEEFVTLRFDEPEEKSEAVS